MIFRGDNNPVFMVVSMTPIYRTEYNFVTYLKYNTSLITSEDMLSIGGYGSLNEFENGKLLHHSWLDL